MNLNLVFAGRNIEYICTRGTIETHTAELPDVHPVIKLIHHLEVPLHGSPGRIHTLTGNPPK